jgi:hypothetical protein
MMSTFPSQYKSGARHSHRAPLTRVGRKQYGNLVSHFFQVSSNVQAQPVVMLAAISILQSVVTVHLGGLKFEIRDAPYSVPLTFKEDAAQVY